MAPFARRFLEMSCQSIHDAVVMKVNNDGKLHHCHGRQEHSAVNTLGSTSGVGVACGERQKETYQSPGAVWRVESELLLPAAAEAKDEGAITENIEEGTNEQVRERSSVGRDGGRTKSGRPMKIGCGRFGEAGFWS